LFFLSLLHLIRHALFKSTLFIQVGFIIHNFFRQQDGRNYSFISFWFTFFQIQLVLTLFCLCGLLFLSGAVRKELILFYFFSEYYNFFISIFYFFIIFLTFSYRYHL